MSGDKLSAFLNNVVGLTANMPGSGISSAGFMETKSAHQQILEDAKKKVFAFANEYRKPEPNEATLKHLSGQVEGALQGLHAYSVIDDKGLDKLLSELHEL